MFNEVIGKDGGLYLSWTDGSQYTLSWHQAKLVFTLLGRPLTRDEVRAIFFDNRKEGEPLTKVQRASMARSIRRLKDSKTIEVRPDGMFIVDEGSRDYLSRIKEKFNRYFTGTYFDYLVYWAEQERRAREIFGR